MRVLIEVKKDISSKIIIENQSNLVSYLCYIVMDIRESNPPSKKCLRWTKIVNLYDNKVWKRQLSEEFYLIVWEAI